MSADKIRLEVFNGLRSKTRGGLFKKDLQKNAKGRIVSKRKSAQAKASKHLGKFLKGRVPKAAGSAKKSDINPLTKQPYDKKSASGFVSGGKISIDNIVKGKRKRKARQKN